MRNFIEKINRKAIDVKTRVSSFARDRKGDLATNTIGAIIVAVVIIGLLIVAVNNFFPTFFSDMFQSMKDKLNGNW